MPFTDRLDGGENNEDNLPKEKESEKRAMPREEVLVVPFTQENKERTFRIGTKEFKNVFAWGPEDMSGIDPAVAVYRLYTDPTFPPVKQKKRLFNDEKNTAIREEVQALLKAQEIRELKFHAWVANVVLVKKPNNKWWMCTDFTNLNKACAKDFYLLPFSGRLVDGSAGHEVFDFMDVSRGYHQIRMAPKDEEKTAFINEY
ncbi:hypothetical protein LIER_13285 [Lithospermum erythrorhizon]|uniref:Uncharacterized protein n=1 Tax=Lithospermum erythrorhizon TaxID=34254 RepID=A0AAV3PVR8_LITER